MEKNVVILGICNRASCTYDVSPNFHKWNILDLKSQFLSPIFPLPIEGIYIGLAINPDTLNDPIRIDFVDDKDNKVGDITVSFSQEQKKSNTILNENKNCTLSLLRPSKGWITQFLKINSTFLIYKPGEYQLIAYVKNEIIDRHSINFIPVDIPEISDEQKLAIKSNPNSKKKAIIEFGCINCDSKYKVYTALDRDKELEGNDYIYYREIKDKFECQCGSTSFDLTYIKKNFHSLLLGLYGNDRKINFIPTYERTTIEDIRNKFIELIDQKPKEEEIQIFFNNNPIVFSSLSAKSIIIKPKILTKYIADYGIVTANRELILIEIERADIGLVKKNYGMHSDLNHAFDQVKDWLAEIEDHKNAIFSCLEINIDDVDVIKGLVIAGRDNISDKKELRKIRAYNDARISFLSFDDIVYRLDSLINDLRKV